MRYFSSINSLVTFLIILSFTACTQPDAEEPKTNSTTSELVIRLNQVEASLSRSLYSLVDEAKENAIKSVSVYVFAGETLRKAEHFGAQTLVGGSTDIRITLPEWSEELSAFVVANIKIKDPASKSELLTMMSDIEIGPAGIPDTGMPMASAELKFQPNSASTIYAALARCHSAVYIETPNGRNNEFDVFINGEQRLKGALVLGNNLLAPFESNNYDLTPNYALSATSEREPVAYFYPTNGLISIMIRLAGRLDTLRVITLQLDDTKMRNKKYIIRITGATPSSSSRAVDMDSLQVELLTE